MAHVWHLIKTPQGMLDPDLFELRQQEDARLAEGEVRVRNLWLSLDPMVRSLFANAGQGMPGISVGAPIYGSAVGEVVESATDSMTPGTFVSHYFGWRDFAVLPASSCQRLPADDVPLQSHLGNLGASGQAAYFGLLDVAQAKMGDVVFVSAAAGAVGTMVVQIAKLKGMTVIASTGSAAKCSALTELGADAVFNYRSAGSLRTKLAAAAPSGIDVYFDNVGGEHFDAAVECAKANARFALCGMISNYGDCQPLTLPNPMRLVLKQLRIAGFSSPSFDARRAEFYGDVLRWTKSGQIRAVESIRHGLSAVPTEFCRLFEGANIGKMLVKL